MLACISKGMRAALTICGMHVDIYIYRYIYIYVYMYTYIQIWINMMTIDVMRDSLIGVLNGR